MRLIGMLDSPYVRRVAVSLAMMDVPFALEPLSVFRDLDAFAAINPLVKAPTLVLDDGTQLVDSTLILAVAERLVPAARHLMPAATGDYVAAQRIIGLALAACEKTMQIAYERRLRPVEKQHQPWLERIQAQLIAAYTMLDASFADIDEWHAEGRPLQADITAAIAWQFTRATVPDVVTLQRAPALAALSLRAAALPAFLAYPG
ncbi:glutathione S-transferase [Sphingomonas sp. RHCKR7]|uniref:glutathione S-transferase family protein n=1 Tax=Sphingomonas folli TaxID=2862497 RepID=UPI001C672ED9|nr:glutathione S-transferase [Sphingomonas folli]MBW6525575.1 glutathione S-transferase [Sphingomonas folli]